MLFRPNFCCNCGVKIERIEWGVLTSRRFCEVCAVEHQKYDWLPRLLVGTGILAWVFGVGVWMGSPTTQPPVPLAAGPSEPPRKLGVSTAGVDGIKRQENVDPRFQTGSETLPSAAPPVSASAHQEPAASKKSVDPAVYYCGAMTKKGSPCSRRVKTKDARCWQHAGQPAALVSQSLPDVY